MRENGIFLRIALPLKEIERLEALACGFYLQETELKHDIFEIEIEFSKFERQIL